MSQSKKCELLIYLNGVKNPVTFSLGSFAEAKTAADRTITTGCHVLGFPESGITTFFPAHKIDRVEVLAPSIEIELPRYPKKAWKWWF